MGKDSYSLSAKLLRDYAKDWVEHKITLAELEEKRLFNWLISQLSMSIYNVYSGISAYEVEFDFYEEKIIFSPLAVYYPEYVSYDNFPSLLMSTLEKFNSFEGYKVLIDADLSRFLITLSLK